MSSRGDVFVPAPGITLKQVNSERSRLSQLEESARRQRVGLHPAHDTHSQHVTSASFPQLAYSMAVDNRKTYLEQDKAVLKVKVL